MSIVDLKFAVFVNQIISNSKSPVLGPYWVESVAHKCHLLNYSYLSSWGYTFVYICLSKDIIQIVSSLPSIDSILATFVKKTYFE